MDKLDKRRSSLEIIADMLRLGEAGKTEIMFSVYMSYFQLQKYLNFLLERGLIDRVALGNPSVPTGLPKRA
jgi:predicted transcriptional regulator